MKKVIVATVVASLLSTVASAGQRIHFHDIFHSVGYHSHHKGK